MLKGRPGQAALRELEQVLSGMSDKRLTSDTLCDSDGLMCALGAWMFAKRTAAGVTPRAAKRELRKLDYKLYEADEWGAVPAAMAVLPITATLGWMIQDANDEWAPPNPMQRHAYMLR